MRTHIVPIGNSKGVRIPSTLLKLCRIKSEVDIHLKGRSIIISPIKKKIRDGWEDAFKQMHAHKDDKLLIDDRVSLEMENWEW